MTNITTTVNKEFSPDRFTEQQRRRASVLTGAAHFLGLGEFVVAESSPPAEASPTTDNSIISEQQELQIEATRPFTAADVSASQDAYLSALSNNDAVAEAKDPVTASRPNPELFNTAQAALQDIFGPGSNN